MMCATQHQAQVVCAVPTVKHELTLHVYYLLGFPTRFAEQPVRTVGQMYVDVFRESLVYA